MAIARSSAALLGTDESTGVTLANSTSTSSSLVDVLGDNTSVADVWLYAVLTCTVTTQILNLRFNPGRRANSGTEEYQKANFEVSIATTNGTQKIPLGKRPCPRYLAVDAQNAQNGGSGASITNLTILYELEKLS